MLILSLKSPLGKVNKVCMYVCMYVKSSGVRQSKIRLAGFGRFGCQWVNGNIVFQ